MLSLMPLLLTHLISIWTDLILILLPCNLNAHNYCNYAAEGNSSSTAGRPKFRTSWQGRLSAGWTHSHLRAGSLREHRCPPPPHLGEMDILGFIRVMERRPLSGAGECTGLGTRGWRAHPLCSPIHTATLCGTAQPGCLLSASTHIPRLLCL